MPVSIHHAHGLRYLRRNESAPLRIDAEHVHVDMKNIVATKFGMDAPWQHIHILESF